MRHRLYGKKLGRNKNQRTALFKSLVQELVLHGTITTSESKAKAIKGLVDKIINLAKSERSSHSGKNTQRLLQAYFSNKLLQERLIKEIVPRLESRNSGYTSLVRMGVREGDKATLVKMSIIGNENLKPLEKVKKETTAKKEKKAEKPVEKKVVSEKKVSIGQSVRKTVSKTK